ncbi:MAG: 4Fe-4S binding protein [archaeon]
MVTPTVNREKCLYCGACVAVCPASALKLNEILIMLDKNKCTNCLSCVKICPVGAMIEGKT